MGFVPAIVIKPRDFIQFVAAAVFVSTGFDSSSGGEFPLSFCRQAEFLTGLYVQLADKFLALILGDVFNGMAGFLQDGGFVAHNGLP